MDVANLQVLGDNVLVAGIKTEVRGGVVVGITQDEKPQEGRVLKVGPGRILESGKRSDMSVRPGMRILFNEHTTTKFNLGGKTYFVVREEDIVGYE